MAQTQDFLDQIDANTLARMMAWAADVPGLAATFRTDHAAYGLYCTTRYLGDELLARVDERGRFLFALDLAYWWWFDDLIDEHIQTPTTNLAWTALEATLSSAALSAPDHAAVVDGEAPELGFLRKLSAELWATQPRADDHAWWVRATLGTLLGFRDEEARTRSRAPVTYAEQLEAGMWSATLTNVTAALSVVMKLGFGDRKPLAPTPAERALCLAARIENDRHSLAKERLEGCASNVGVVLERAFANVTDGAHIAAFLVEQQRGYEALLERELVILGDAHPFTQLARGIIATHRVFYAARPQRYSVSGSLPGAT